MKKNFFKKLLVTSIIILVIFNPLASVVGKAKAATQNTSSLGQVSGKAAAAGISCIIAVKADQGISGFINGVVGGATGAAKDKVSGAAGKVPTSDTVEQEKTKENDKNSRTDTAVDLSKKCIRDIVVKMLLDYFADQIIGWIKGEGKPKFVQDWDAFLKDAANVGVGEVVRESGAAFLCEPFKLQVKVSLYPTGRFKQKIDCTMEQIGVNINKFMQDFQNGSWIGYTGVWRPENNYFGQILLTYDEAARRSAAKQEAAKNEALAGGGFLSAKKCIQKNWAEIQACVSEICFSDGCTVNDTVVSDQEGYRFCESLASCDKYEAITPGSVVGKLAAEAVTSDIEWAKNVESWTAAIVNAAVNRVIKEGMAYMTDSLSPSTDVDGNFDPQNSGANATTASTAPNQNAINGLVQANIDELKSIKKSASDNKSKILSLKEKSLSYMKEIFDWETEIKNSCSATDAGTHLTDDNNAITALETDIKDNEDNTGPYKIAINGTQKTIEDLKTEFDNLIGGKLPTGGDFILPDGSILNLLNLTANSSAVYSQEHDNLILKYNPLINGISGLKDSADEELNGLDGITNRRVGIKAKYDAFKSGFSTCPDNLDVESITP